MARKLFRALRRMGRNVKAIDENKLFREFVLNPEVQKRIISLNRREQLFKESKAADGKTLDVYSPFTEVETLLEHGSVTFNFEGLTRQKTAGSPAFLFEDGDFYDSFSVTVNNDNFVIDADTEKEDRDLLDFGEILGLTDESLQVLRGWFKEFLLKVLPKIILQGT